MCRLPWAWSGDADGVRYSGATGEAAPGRAAGEDTVFRIFSMTKAIGAVAATILIDRGKMRFDTPVDDILPEFDNVQVLDRFDGDTPVMRPPKVRATLRHLATHTSGLEYEFWNGDVARYMEATGHPTILSGLKASLVLSDDDGSGHALGLRRRHRLARPGRSRRWTAGASTPSAARKSSSRSAWPTRPSSWTKP